MNSIMINIAPDIEDALKRLAYSRGISVEQLLSDEASDLASQSDVELRFRAMAKEGEQYREKAREILQRAFRKR